MSESFIIRRVAVIGAGLMGSQIAAHLANADVSVDLFDIVPSEYAVQGDVSRSILASRAVERLLNTDPQPFMSKGKARLITPCNLSDDLSRLGEADWIIEAVIEKPEIKREIYKIIQEHRKAGSIVSSNTSTIPLAHLTLGLNDEMAQHFLITHFFNPPRYMRLLEIVASPSTHSGVVGAVSNFADRKLGKTVVICKDTPGFIANRIGVFFLQSVLNAVQDISATVEEVDALFSRPMGMPKTGVFGLLDLIGLDLMPLIAGSLAQALPESDAYRLTYRDFPLIQRLIAGGYTGRRGKGGFYRVNKDLSGSKKIEAINLLTGAYATTRKTTLPSVEAAGKNLRLICEAKDNIGKLAWRVLSEVLCYAADIAADISNDVNDIDTAMQLGFNWKQGPFALIDRLGAGWIIDKLTQEGRAIPPLLAMSAKQGSFFRVANGISEILQFDGTYKRLIRPSGVLLLSDIKRETTAVERNGSASLWDIGMGVMCIEFHSHMNTIDPDTLKMIARAITLVSQDKARWKGLVIHNEGENFSVGANLGLALFAYNVAMFAAIDDLVKQGQETFRALRYAAFPTVAAPSGLALGGGCEVLMHCAAIQAHAESYIGLVETGVGVIPAWGGCARMLERTTATPTLPHGPLPAVSAVFEIVAQAKVSKSAEEARTMFFLRPSDGITMNRDRLLYEARQRVVDLALNYVPPKPASFLLPGESGRAAVSLMIESMRMAGKALPHDVVVSNGLADVLCGGTRSDITEPVPEDDIRKIEYDTFMNLIKNPDTILRIETMLATGKPLRN